jgi:hypothetical protein
MLRENNPEGAAQFDELKVIAKDAMDQAEDAQEEAEEATNLALKFEEELNNANRDVEHLTKTVAHLKQVQAKLKFELSKSGGKPVHRPGHIPGAAFIDNDEVKRMYGDEINDLKKTVGQLQEKLKEGSEKEAAAKFRCVGFRMQADTFPVARASCTVSIRVH